MKTGLTNMALGVFIAAIGLGVTALSYSLVSGSGGTYVVATGAFVVGAWRFLLGIFQVIGGALRGSPARQAVATPQSVTPRPPSSMVPAMSAPAMSAPPMSAPPMSAPPMSAPPMSAPPMPPPSPVIASPKVADGAVALHVVGGLLFAQAVMRVVFLAIFVSRVGSAILNNPFSLLFSIALPAAFAIGGVVAGAMLFTRSRAAVSFGQALCIAGLLYQTFVLYRIASIVSFHAASVTWVLIGVHFAVYVAGLIVLSRSA